jgi:hypothetical protein
MLLLRVGGPPDVSSCAPNPFEKPGNREPGTAHAESGPVPAMAAIGSW